MTDEEVDKARRFRTDAEIVFMQLANQEGYDDHNIETIETALRLTSEQARAEGVKEGMVLRAGAMQSELNKNFEANVQRIRAEGFNAGKEEAATHLNDTADKIRGDYNGPDLLCRMATEIRAMRDKP